MGYAAVGYKPAKDVLK